MSFWCIVWAVVVLAGPQPAIFTAEENPRFQTQEACEAAVLLEEHRMQDWFLGAHNLSLDVEIHVKGACKLNGTPS